uniref:(northern house mosquito) hypothetical protein n=1 Tax=Culex pipiens TaxID=7175 RepID=A0A8D8NL02_CULPI
MAPSPNGDHTVRIHGLERFVNASIAGPSRVRQPVQLWTHGQFQSDPRFKGLVRVGLLFLSLQTNRRPVILHRLVLVVLLGDCGLILVWWVLRPAFLVDQRGHRLSALLFPLNRDVLPVDHVKDVPTLVTHRYHNCGHRFELLQ